MTGASERTLAAFLTLVSEESLAALEDGLRTGDGRLVQKTTTSPPPMPCVSDWPCEGACLVGYCGWRGDGLETVGEVEEYFARMCFEIDRAIGEAAGCRWLLNWYDESPMAEVVAEVIPAIHRERARRRLDGLRATQGK
jgi:hypothetical protein